MKAGDKAFINTPGRLDGCPVEVQLVHERKGPQGPLVEVALLEERAGRAAGTVLTYLQRDLLPALEPGTRVTFAAEYLRRNSADPREYGRVATVVRAMEGTLVALDWDDRMGPAVVPTAQLSPCIVQRGRG